MHPTIDAVTGRETDRLDGGDVIRLHAPLALGSLVGDLGALLKALEAAAGYARMVHEDVLATLVGGDEAVAFIVTEPLYRSLGHIWSPPFFSGAPMQQKAAPLVEGGASLTIKPTSIYCIPTIRPLGPGLSGPGPVGARVWPGRRGEALTRLWTTKSNTLAFKCC